MHTYIHTYRGNNLVFMSVRLSIKAFLQVKANNFVYFSLEKQLSRVPVVSWQTGQPANPIVYEW
jgi:hypothetical protein